MKLSINQRYAIRKICGLIGAIGGFYIGSNPVFNPFIQGLGAGIMMWGIYYWIAEPKGAQKHE